jgi:Flp pilus assembly pilin Flp
MKRDYHQKGQGTVEYTMVVICIAAALITMQYYIKRAIQGRMRESADSIGEQYAPKHMDSQVTITQTGTTTIKAEAVQDPNDVNKFGLKTTSTTDETTTRTGHENTKKFEDKLFD